MRRSARPTGAAALSLAVLLAAAWAFPGCTASEKPAEPRPVILITLDTTRADRLGCYGHERAATPVLDHLAETGVRFDRAYTPVPLTLPAHASLLTGAFPASHEVHNNGTYALGGEFVTLAEALQSQGFRTAAFVSSFTLDSRFGLDQGFDVYDDVFDRNEALKNYRSERRGDDLTARFLEWLEGRPEGAFFAWIHFFDPHLPYAPPEPFRGRFEDSPYDGEIAFVDACLGRIMSALDGRGITKRSLVIIAGDHGEGLGERGEIDHGLFVYNNTLRVPLILHAENLLPAGAVIKDSVSLVDVFPTILDLLDFEIPKSVQGASLLPLLKGKTLDLPVVAETRYPAENFGWAPLAALIVDPWKYIRAPRPELYNLEGDPGEESNVIREHPGLAEDMDRSLAKYGRLFSSPADPGRKHPSVRDEEMLKSLGYLHGGAPAAGDESRLPDPKDKIQDYLNYYRGNLLETQGRYDEAAPFYEEVLRLNPDAPWNYVNLALLEMKRRNPEKAVSILEEARRRFPDSTIVASRLMMVYSGAGMLDEALEAGRGILGLDPRNFDAHFLMGSMEALKGRWNEAVEHYERALSIEPENRILRLRRAYALAASGRPSLALPLFDDLKAEAPDDFQAWSEAARVYEALGDYPEAIANARRAAELDPTRESCYRLAVLLVKTGDRKEAIVWLEKFLESEAGRNPAQRREALKMLSDLRIAR